MNNNVIDPWGDSTASSNVSPIKKKKPSKRSKNFSDFSPKTYGYMLIALILVWLASGFYMVQPDEQGVQLVFGKWDKQVKEAGLHYNLPQPIGKTFVPQVTQERQTEIGFRTARGGISNVPEESLMLTGDGNIIDIDFVVTWKISDAGKYLFNIRNPEDTLKKVAESAMREIIGKSELQKALADERTVIQQETGDLIQKTMDEYNSGIQINEVKLQRVDPPADVIEAFNDVQRALSDKETMSNEADAYRNKILPEAKGQAEEMVQDAEAYKAQVVNLAKGEANRFNQVYESYAKAKDVTRTRMYIDTMEEVMKNSDKVIVDEKAGSSLLPHLNLKGEGVK